MLAWHTEGVTIPQRMTFVTIGAHSVGTLRAFYRSWGWIENEGSTDDYASFDVLGARLSLYPIDRLRDEAAPDAAVPARDAWSGLTFAINLGSTSEVDAVYDEAVRSGAAS